jgi:hypothetical protein
MGWYPRTEIRDPHKTYPGSRAQKSTRSWILVPGSGSSIIGYRYTIIVYVLIFDFQDWQFVQLGEQQNFGIKTAGLEDKATACQMLVCYARSEP